MSPLESNPSRLGVFVSDFTTGEPAARIPIYAEVVVPRLVPRQPAERRFSRQIHTALLAIDPEAANPLGIVEIAEQVFGETIEAASRDRLEGDFETVRELFERVFEATLAAAGKDRVDDIRPFDLKQLIAAAIRQHASEFDLQVVPDEPSAGLIWTNPLGVLATDHVGYASFDLTKLRPEVLRALGEAIELARQDANIALPVSIWIQPYGQGRFDALTQRRFTRDAVVAHVRIEESLLPRALLHMGPRALQNPGLTDWLLSPASFAANPSMLVGETGCEELVPSNVSLQEFFARQVVRITDPPEELDVPEPYRAAYVDEYKITWHALGHSLGEIQYSLPLAPGESVKLAVVDWSWDSLVRRDEQTRLDESVLHQTHRDRTIAEVVRAALSELQRGSSSISSSSVSAGATAGVNLGLFSIGGSLAGSTSFGGTTASSEGSRLLAAENVQRLSDSFAQASSAQRALHSTVVIQARQEERETIQTRTFTNYNHSHTLTVLYYEVLRHYLVTVERIRRRPAVLAKIPPSIERFDDRTLLLHRHVLEPALLDPSLRPGFTAIEKLRTIQVERAAQGLSETDDIAIPAPPYEGDLLFDLFEFTITTGGGRPEDVLSPGSVLQIFAMLPGGELVPLQRWEGLSPNEPLEELLNFNAGGRLRNANEPTSFFASPVSSPGGARRPIRWADLLGFFIATFGETWRLGKMGVAGYSGRTRIDILPFKEYGRLFGRYGGDDIGNNTFMEDIRRPAQVGAPSPILSPLKSLTPEERYQRQRLLDHVEANRRYYSRLVLLSTDSSTIAVQFESAPWRGTERLIDHAEPSPLDVFGDYVAYPLARGQLPRDALAINLAAALRSDDPVRIQWARDQLDRMREDERLAILDEMAQASARSERLITLPTRGVFAEGKLGHCNVSEEIDNTRFWKWEEHPIPIEAPEINPVTPVTPSPQPVNPSPTAFPQSLVNIVNPSPAPDPTGLAAGLSLLGTPNVFRDMSGRQEVADLLKKVSDGSISMAEAANRAREIQAKHGEALDRQQKDLELGLAQVDADVAKELLQQRREEARQVSPSEAHDAIKVSESEMRKGNTTPAEHKEYTKQQLQNVKGATPKPAAVSVKRKIFVFKAKDYEGMDLEFAVKVSIFDHKDRDPAGGSKRVYEGQFIRAGSTAIDFKEADPLIDVQVDTDPTSVQIGPYTLQVPKITLTTDSYVQLRASQSHVQVRLQQQGIKVDIEEESLEKAAEELSTKYGAELGFNEVVAAKILAEKAKSTTIERGGKQLIRYSLIVPGKSFTLSVA